MCTIAERGRSALRLGYVQTRSLAVADHHKTIQYMSILENLPVLSGKDAYLVMLEFLRMEFELAGRDGTVHLGGLLSELELGVSGESSDPGGAAQFEEAFKRVMVRQKYEAE